MGRYPGLYATFPSLSQGLEQSQISLSVRWEFWNQFPVDMEGRLLQKNGVIFVCFASEGDRKESQTTL